MFLSRFAVAFYPAAIALVLASMAGQSLAQSATIEGTVTENGSGTPIGGATVAVSDPANFRQTWTTSTTNAAGEYTITVNMQAGETRDFVIEAAGPDHAPTRYNYTGNLPCFFNCGPGGEIAVTEGSKLTSIDLSLDTGGRVSGTITDADTGNPLPGAGVSLITPDLAQYSFEFSGIAQSGGAYTTALAVEPGSYFLQASGGGANYVTQAWDGYPCEFGVCPIADSDELTISAGSVAGGFDFALEPGASLSGNLHPDDIEKLIFLYNAAGQVLAIDFMFAGDLPETAWSFDGLAGGSYYVQLGPRTGQSSFIRILQNGLLCPWSGCERARGTPLSIPAGAGLSLAPITLDEGGQVEGTIIDANTNLPPTGVPADAQLGNYDIIDAGGAVVGGGRIVEEGGDIVMQTSSAVPAGDYHVRTYSEFRADGIGHEGINSSEAIDGYMDAIYPNIPCAGIDCDLAAAGTVSVTTGNTTSITIEIETGSTISGRVVDQATSVPIPDAVVRVLNAAGDTIARAMTDGAGEYRFGALPAGNYFVRTSMSGHLGPGHSGVQNAYFDRLHGASGSCSEALCDPATASAVTLDGTNDQSLGDLEVTSGPVISGQIIDLAGGFPVPRGAIEVFTDTGDFVGRYKVNFATARYQTTALPPGTYTLVPDVSPAYSGVSPSGGTTPSATSSSKLANGGFTVVMGEEDVDADLQVVDQSVDRLFSDRFSEAQ
ncbi:MAG: carboxypeptidase-like regulatory domain-containing protein [Xanthomonadales bacterium]|nr:carboxypeptidase-like regulatory domain-containing protein [Xanthomonadales bacterium]